MRRILIPGLMTLALLAGCDSKSASPDVHEEAAATPAPAAVPAPAPVVADWCAGHGLPESKCTLCNPQLIPQFKAAGDWCEEHGFPESACPVCNPQQPPGAAPVADWCLEHGLPESQCTLCNPQLIPQFKAAGDWCEEHGFPESVCPLCNPQEPPPGVEEAALEARIVYFRTPDFETVAGIETEPARLAQAATHVGCTARIEFDGDRVADVRAIVPGIVRKVHAELGETVRKGAPLFELESTRIGEIQGTLAEARGRLETAQANLERQQALYEGRIVSKRDLEVAEQEVIAAQSAAGTAQAALAMAGVAEGAAPGRYTLRAPLAGTLVKRPAVLGLLATEETSLAMIADTSVMWALCDVPEADALRVERGQPVEVLLEAGREEPLTGRVTWIAAEVDPRTRTVAARAEVPNPLGRLRAHQFARARIETGQPGAAVSVPRAAVQRVGEREVVFVRTSPGVYEPRVVRRHGSGGLVQVEGNVRQGEAVVTTGAVLLRTEVMPGSIGAGCCEVEPRGT